MIYLSAGAVSAATIISNNFDGNAGNDIGGTFGIVSNGIESSDTTDASTGLISFTGNNATVGFSTATSFDAQAFSSLSVTWVVSSVTNGNAPSNGWFFGLQSAQGMENVGSTLWNNTPDAIGVNLFGGKGAGGGSVSEDNPSLSHIDVTSGANAPADAALADGFTVSITLNDDNTYTVSSVGLTSDFDQNLSGAFPGDFTYADLGNTTYAVMTAQHQGTGSVMSIQVDSVLVTDGFQIPEPSTLVIAVLGLMGLLGFGRGRRR
jgi:hypothetical protein